ncbi:unnamed protein product [Arctogadus glacialis]
MLLDTASSVCDPGEAGDPNESRIPALAPKAGGKESQMSSSREACLTGGDANGRQWNGCEGRELRDLSQPGCSRGPGMRGELGSLIDALGHRPSVCDPGEAGDPNESRIPALAPKAG